jgi:hypothetical protein
MVMAGTRIVEEPGNVRFGSFVTEPFSAGEDVCPLWSKSDHFGQELACRLCAISGHQASTRTAIKVDNDKSPLGKSRTDFWSKVKTCLFKTFPSL